MIRSSLGLWEQGQTEATVEPCPVGLERRRAWETEAAVEPRPIGLERRAWVVSPRHSCGISALQLEGAQGCPGGPAGRTQPSACWVPSSVPGLGTETPPAVSVQSLSRVRLCDPVDCSTPGLPVHHQLAEFAQTPVHRVGDAIQPPQAVWCTKKRERERGGKLGNNAKRDDVRGEAPRAHGA